MQYIAFSCSLMKWIKFNRSIWLVPLTNESPKYPSMPFLIKDGEPKPREYESVTVTVFTNYIRSLEPGSSSLSCLASTRKSFITSVCNKIHEL